MHLAAKAGNKHTVQYLLEKGGQKSLQIKNKAGKLPVGKESNHVHSCF